MKFELVKYCDFDKYAAKAYSLIHNEPEEKNLGDITKVNEKELADFNVMVGGSPCQDFSVAGRQEGAKWACKECGYEYNPLEAHYSQRNKCPKCSSENIEKTRSSLLVEWLRILKEKKPNFAIYENVKNIVGKQFKSTFDLFEKELQEYGYNTYWKVLNAKNYGIPQNRERVYLIIIRKDVDNGKFKFPEGFDNGIRLKDVLESEVDEKYYISQDKVDKLIKQIDGQIHVREATKKGYAVAAEGDSINIQFPNSNTRRGRVQKETAGTLETQCNQAVIAGTYNQKDGFKEKEIGCTIDANYFKGLGCNQDRNAVLNLGNVNPSGRGMNGKVYSEEGLAPTITTNKGEGSKILQIGMLEMKGNEQVRRVYSPDGLSPTLNTMGGGNRQPKILEDFYSNRDVREYEEYSPTLRADRQGLKVAQGCSLRTRNYIGQPQQLEVRKDELSNSVTTVQKDSMTTDFYRIRKLTPLECFRLMGFDDQDYYILKENKISDTQIYKMAGNSIVVDVLYYIFKELKTAMPYLFADVKLGSFFSGIGAFEKALNRIQK
jgi:DNA (cytosine-5)-methyltransferase 1